MTLLDATKSLTRTISSIRFALSSSNPVKSQVKETLPVTDEGICNHHLGMSIHQGNDAISINQNATILSILDEFSDLAKCNVPAQNFTDEDTPKQGGHKANTTGQRFLLHFEFALNYICHFQSCPENVHYTRFIDLLGYLLRFPVLSLSYPNFQKIKKNTLITNDCTARLA